MAAHTVTYARRLFDVVGLLGSDLRLRMVFTVPPHQFGDGTDEFLREQGAVVVPWAQAIHDRFDLALVAGSRYVDEVQAPLVLVPHGGRRSKLTPQRDRGGAPAVRGMGRLSREYLVRNGMVVPSAVVLPHVDEWDLLAEECPEALRVAHVVGDPAYDALVASVSERERYREALGVGRGQKLVVISSTWGPTSLFAHCQALFAKLSELPEEKYVSLAVIHPNVWAAHGALQVRAWLAEYRRRGLRLLSPTSEWRSAVVAADYLVGDHGSVTAYAAAAGTPVLLATFPEREIASGSVAADLAILAPALSLAGRLDDQLAHAAARREAEAGSYERIGSKITSEPGRFAGNMRRLLYGLLGLGQPAGEPPTDPVPPPRVLDEPLPADREGAR